MREGAWINGITGKFAWVDEHASFIQREKEAMALGLPAHVYDRIKSLKWDFDGQGREEILAIVMSAGFIRMRGHGAYWTFEFTMKTIDALWACMEFLMEFAGPFTGCRFSNLRTKEQIEMPFEQFKKTMQEDPDMVMRVASLIPPSPRLACFQENTKVAAGFSRLMQIMIGQVPTIHTFAILSVDNPMGQPAPAEENNKRREKFRGQLRYPHQYGYVQHGGVYGSFERPFFVMNCNRETAIGWGKQYNQESIIFGRVDHDSLKVTFEMIYGDTVESVRETVLQVRGNQDDFYSICKGRKFQIPFFDDNYAPEKKLSYMTTDFNDNANLEILASEADWIREDAAGLTRGMGIMTHRHRIVTALKALKVIE